MHATLAERAEPAAVAPAGGPDRFRPEIQGLRAVAVLLVVAYHLYPNRVSGGYVGVDVFFVISGYLITSHLHREAAATSRLSLTRFWARRIRRLLPASLLVLGVSALLTWWWVPTTQWDQTLRQLKASTLYVQNWALADDAVDYSAAGNVPTLVQHYWSLSVEEQFYLVWPVLVLGVLLAVRRRGAVAVRRTLLGAVALIAVGSFVYSVTATSSDAARAYFVTPTRAWEFAAGALLALAGTAAATGWARSALGWVGLGAVLWSGLALTDSTPFPGWVAAVPVLGTVAVIAAGRGDGPLTAGRLLALPPMRLVGDISYSVYLWHWPLIVVTPYVTGVPLRTRDKAAILALTLLLSWASTRWVEDRLRTAPFLTRRPWRSYAAAVAGMVVLLALVGVLRADLDRTVRESRESASDALSGALEGVTPCVGPVALDPEHRRTHHCGSVAGRDGMRVDPAAVALQNRVAIAYPGCESDLNKAEVLTCSLGATEDPRRSLAIVGDSHATHWFSALDRLGEANDWLVQTYTRASCPFTDARRTLPDEPAHRYRYCRQGNTEIERLLLADPGIDTVLVSAYSSAYGWAVDGGTAEDGAATGDPAADGFHSLWRRLTEAGKRVVVIRDVPAVKDRLSAPDCLIQHPRSPTSCATTRSEGLTPDVQAEAVTGAPEGVHLVDLTDQFCDEEWCYAGIGGVVVYRDYSHLSQEYSTLLGPYLVEALRRLDAP